METSGARSPFSVICISPNLDRFRSSHRSKAKPYSGGWSRARGCQDDATSGQAVACAAYFGRQAATSSCAMGHDCALWPGSLFTSESASVCSGSLTGAARPLPPLRGGVRIPAPALSLGTTVHAMSRWTAYRLWRKRAMSGCRVATETGFGPRFAPAIDATCQTREIDSVERQSLCCSYSRAATLHAWTSVSPSTGRH